MKRKVELLSDLVVQGKILSKYELFLLTLGGISLFVGIMIMFFEMRYKEYE